MVKIGLIIQLSSLWFFFSCVVPDICFKNESTIFCNNLQNATVEIYVMKWVSAQSASHKGTVAPLSFIAMMSTALIV